MKKKKFVLITLAIIATLSLVGCGESVGTETEFSGQVIWYITKSPITGRYYEVRYQARWASMSEVTEQEYLEYLEMIGGK